MTWSFHAHISLSQRSHHLCEFVVCEVVLKTKKNPQNPEDPPAGLL